MSKFFPLVSVIIPTRNRIHLLSRAIQSVYDQDYPNFEIIVVDDGSDVELSTSFKKNFPEVYFLRSDENKGGGAARNLGCTKASGKYYSFLDDDDVYLSNKLQLQIEFLEKNPTYKLVGCRYVNVKFNRSIKSPLTYSNFLGGTSTFMIEGNFFNEIGGFNSSLASAQDWDLLIRASLKGEIKILNEKLVYYDMDVPVKITTSFNNTYMGHRFIYFEYKSLLNKRDKQKLFLLVYYFRSKVYKKIVPLNKSLLIRLLKCQSIRFVFSYINYIR